MIYITVLILLLLLSFRYDINGKTKGRDQWYLAVLVMFILIAGMRWRIGTDTTVYIHQFYHETPVLSDIKSDSFALGSKPLWLLLNSIVLTMGGRFYIIQFIQAAFVNYLIFRYIKKHSPYIFVCVSLYFVWMFLAYNTQEMKASMAVAVCLYANDYILEKRYYQGVFLIIIGCFFHFSTVLILITPIFFFIRLNKTGLIILCLSFFAGIVIQQAFGDYLEMFEFDATISQKEQHWALGIADNDHNINYYLVNVCPFILYSLILLKYFKSKYPEDPILRFEPCILIGVITYLLYTNVHFFYRFTHFYAIYLIFILSSFFVKTIKRNNKLGIGVAISKCFVLLFPILFSMFFQYYATHNYRMYYPYSSIIEKEISKERERRFNLNVVRPVPNKNEY